MKNMIWILIIWLKKAARCYYNAIVTLISIDDILQHTYYLYSVQYPGYKCGGKRGFARAMLSSAMASSTQQWLFWFHDLRYKFNMLI
jgi:hypothetical protein